MLSVQKKSEYRKKTGRHRLKKNLSGVKSPSIPATDHILFGMVLLCRYIVPTVNTTVNTASAAMSIQTGK